MGKKCNFKNYDLFPAKNDFYFEQRDWFTVRSSELPEGSQLIMGLTPFGVKASLANQFINNALKFKPKLLILIVPPETRRLDLRMYDLIWEDSDLLSGESFYLPGSFNNKEQQLSQWNVITPPLYLWSRHDWTRKHLEIANRSGQSQFPGQPSCSQLPTWNYLLEDQQDCYGDFSNLMNVYGSFPSLLADVLLPDHNHDLNEHNFNGNFVASNGAVFNNSSTVTSFENPRAMNAAGWLETNVCSSPVDLEDLNIFPTDSPSNIIS